MSAIVLLLIAFPLFVSLMLGIPAVQNFVVRCAATFATEKVGATVHIDKISIGLLNTVQVRGFYVEDLDRDTLIYADRVTASISALGNLNPGKCLRLDVGRVENGKFILRETERGVMNIKEVVDRISKHRGKYFKMVIGSLDVDSVDFRLERLVHRNPECGVDYGNMQLFGICGHVNDFTVEMSNISGEVTALSFAERSGFVLDCLTADRLMVDRGVVAFDNLRVQTGESDIRLPELSIKGKDWADYKDFIRNVRIDGRAEHSNISSYDAGYFAPRLRSWDTTISDATFAMNGTVADFKASISSLRLADGGQLKAVAAIKGLPVVRRTRFDVSSCYVDASSHEVLRLLNNIARLKLPDNVNEIAERAEHIKFSASYHGTLRQAKANARMNIGCGGRLVANATMRPDDDRRAIVAEFSGDNVNLGSLIGKKVLGDASFAVKADGSVGSDAELMCVADISSLGIKGYDYSNIRADVAVAEQCAQIELSSSDPACRMRLNGMASFAGEEPAIDAIATIDHADLNVMNVNGRDSLSVLSANVDLSLRGKSLDTVRGEINISEATYRYGDDNTLNSDLVALAIESDEDTRSVKLTSDFADAVFETRSPYKDVAYYVKNLLSHYVPMFYDEEDRHDIDLRSEELRRNIALLSVTTKRLDPLLDCIASGLEVAEGSKAQVFMNPSANRFLARVSSDYVMRDNLLVTELNMDMDNRNDSLSMRLNTADAYSGAFHVSQLGVQCGVKDNRVDATLSFADSILVMRGDAALRAEVSRRNGMRHVDVNVLPSSLTRREKRWDVSSGRIEIDSSRVAINKFSIESRRQQLLVDGVASRSDQDTIMLSLRDFDIAPFAQITSRLGYNIEGLTNGYVRVHSALGSSRIYADVAMDSIRVNNIAMPALNLASKWDFGRSRASLAVSVRERCDTIIRGYFAPAKRRYYARMRIPNVDMSLLDPMLKGVIEDTNGEAAVELTLNGRGREADLSGSVDIKGLRTKVAYTNCTYRLARTRVDVLGNRFIVKGAEVKDDEGRQGTLDMDLSLNHLSNVEYRFDVNVDKAKVLNTTRAENDMFYGTVYASGNATIRGDKSGVTMDIAAATEDGSKFFMPLSGQSSIKAADFVTFVAGNAPDTTSVLIRKKLAFERRQRRQATTRGAMDINMALDVRPNAEMQLVIDPTVGDIIKGRGDGALNMRINPKLGIFEMYGDYTIEEGSYLFTLQNIVNKKFVIERGSMLQWSGEPLDAVLNIDAVYKLKASLQPLLEGSLTQNNISSRAVPVECVIHLTDRLTHPTVDFDVIVPNVDSDVQSLIANSLSTPESKSQQFLYLLVANSFISESNSTSASAAIGASSAATTGFELLSNQLSNWLSTDDYNVVIRYRPKTEQMSDEVDFGFSKGLVNNRLLIEVEGNYIVDKSQMVNASSNFTGEAYITWLIDKAGSLRLKGFTHTIDRFDENQGLQETGLGIYYKEDFDNFADLRRRVAARFSRRRRNEDREERRAERKSETEWAEANPECDREDDRDEGDGRDYDERW